MDLNRYQLLAQRTEKMFPELAMRLIHGALGLGSEIGELMELGATPDVVEELGDILWYTALITNALGLSLLQLRGDKTEPLFEDPGEASVGLINHAGELIGLIKKHVIYDQKLDLDACRMRIANILWFMDSALAGEDVNLDHAAEQNIDKLRKRYPDKYTDAAAAERADKAIDATREWPEPDAQRDNDPVAAVAN